METEVKIAEDEEAAPVDFAQTFQIKKEGMLEETEGLHRPPATQRAKKSKQRNTDLRNSHNVSRVGTGKQPLAEEYAEFSQEYQLLNKESSEFAGQSANLSKLKTHQMQKFMLAKDDSEVRTE